MDTFNMTKKRSLIVNQLKIFILCSEGGTAFYRLIMMDDVFRWIICPYRRLIKTSEIKIYKYINGREGCEWEREREKKLYGGWLIVRLIDWER